MRNYLSIIKQAGRQHLRVLLLTSFGFVVIYYSGLLLLTMLRFGEIPNYFEFYNVFKVYGLILSGTPALSDAIPIMIDEPWFETGYKNPNYYGIATWSFMLIPPKMFLVFLMGILLGIFTVLTLYSRQRQCAVDTNKRLFAAAGVSSVFISLTSATLTWVVCCATPSWVVALAMLGMSASLALMLEPLGQVLTLLALATMLATIFYQLHQLTKAGQQSNTRLQTR